MVQSSRDLETMLSDPKKALFHMAVPLFLALLITNLQTFVDSLWCAGLGPDPLSAISMAAPVYRIIVSIGLAIGVGSSGAIALSLGKNDKQRADDIASQAIVVAILMSLIMIIVMVLCGRFLLTVSGDGYNTDLGMDYLQPFIICTIPLIVNGLVIGLVRSEGAAKKSMVISMIASLSNIILDPIFIYYFGWGLEGAAWATCLSVIISTLVGVSFYLRGKMFISPKLRHFRFRKDLLKDISVVAIPFSVEALLICLMIIPENGIVAGCGGPEGLAIYVNAFNFVGIATIPAAGLASALIPLISAQLGQRSAEKIKITFRYSLTVVIIIGAVLGVLMFLFAPQLAGLYTYSEDMKALEEEMIQAIRIYSLTPIFMGIIRITSSMIQALRRAVVSTVLMFVREIFFISFYYIAAQYSMVMIYWSVDLTNVIAAMLMLSIILIIIRQLVRSKDFIDSDLDEN
jgi:putative MATE family efflux protein